MLSRLVAVLGLVLVVVLAVVDARVRFAGRSVERRINNALIAADLNQARNVPIQVEVEHGWIRLTGITSANARTLASDIARDVGSKVGIQGVTNDLQARACRHGDLAALGQFLDSLKRSASGALAQVEIDYRLNDTCVVTLDGRVPSSEVRDSVEQAARSIEGVSGVVNALWVGALTTQFEPLDGSVQVTDHDHQLRLDLTPGMTAALTRAATGDMQVAVGEGNRAALPIRWHDSLALAEPSTRLVASEDATTPALKLTHGRATSVHAQGCEQIEPGQQFSRASVMSSVDAQPVIGPILFPPDSQDLSPAAVATVYCVAQMLAEYPNKHLRLFGYTDVAGDKRDKAQLSESRARQVFDHLVAHAVPANRIEWVGRGAENPIASNATPAGRAQNRRVELQFQ